MSTVFCVFRDANENDDGFIYNSWLKSYFDGGIWARHVPAQIFFDNHKKVVKTLLQNSRVIIACNPSDSSQIFGYSVIEKSYSAPTIHYMYVKLTYRRLGIARALMNEILEHYDPSLPVTVSHMTRVLEEIRENKSVIYNPYTAMEARFDET